MLIIPETDPRAVAAVRAIQSGDVPALRQLLDASPELANARVVDRIGVARALLHVAADWPGHFPNGAEAVTTLAAAGAEVSAALLHGSSEETPLHWAASSDDVAVLDALLDCGADIEAPGAVFTGGTPMSDAVIFGNWRAARRLLERGATTQIWQAAALGLLDSVQQQVRRQPAPTLQEITNSLWHACRGGQLVVSRYLLELGASLNWIGYEDKTPLDVARESGALELADWLAERGARSAADL